MDFCLHIDITQKMAHYRYSVLFHNRSTHCSALVEHVAAFKDMAATKESTSLWQCTSSVQQDSGSVVSLRHHPQACDFLLISK